MARSSQSRRQRTAARALQMIALIALVAFHVVLLAGRLSDASILEPAVLARWGGALALILIASLFQRFAPARLRGRRALIVFWLLAAFLHLFGPLDLDGHQLDLELALGLAVPVLAFALLLEAASRDALPDFRIFAQQLLLLPPAPVLSSDAPRGPPQRSL